MQTKRITLLSLYVAIALALFVLELQVPLPIALPGVKLGLSNIVTLVALLFLDRKAAASILFIRILLGAFLVGIPSTLLFSTVGGGFALLVMSITLRLFKETHIWIVSILGALAHNIGQIFAAMLYLQTTSLLVFLPVLILSAILSGCFTGFVAKQLLPYRKWLSF